MLSKKRLTKMLNPAFRARMLNGISSDKLRKYKIPQMARYVVDSQLAGRDKTFAKDKSRSYGFCPVNVICAVLNDSSIDKRLFEFNIINGFLAKNDDKSAVEVVTCILIEWVKENKNIRDFDIDVIDRELARIESEYIASQKTKTESDAEQDNTISSMTDGDNADCE